MDLIEIRFPGGKVIRCQKLIMSAGIIEGEEGEWEHAHFGEFTAEDIVHVLETQNQLLYESGKEILALAGIDLPESLDEMEWFPDEP